MDQWERNYYITALAGANNGSSLVVMSKGKVAKACSSKVPFLLQKYSFNYSVNLPRHNVYSTVLQS